MPEGFALRRIRFALRKLHNSLVSEGFALRRIRFALRKLHNFLVSEGFAHDPQLDRTGEIAIARTDS